MRRVFSCLSNNVLKNQKIFSLNHRLYSATPLKEGEPAPLPSDDRVLSDKIQKLVEEIANLSILEASDLNYGLRKKLNLPEVSAFPPVGMMMAPASAGKAPESASEDSEESVPQKISFSVKLTKFDDSKKIALIKEIRNILPDLNLVQAKKFIETAPVEVKGDLNKTEADELKALIEKVGGTVEIV
uniref:39S ribosomal protein L12, mitochondrial n=1 Tax=Strongyloides stercoralis TaxID=6248 RepID=A0A0K0EQZ3_STRER